MVVASRSAEATPNAVEAAAATPPEARVMHVMMRCMTSSRCRGARPDANGGYGVLSALSQESLSCSSTVDMCLTPAVQASVDAPLRHFHHGLTDIGSAHLGHAEL